MPKITYLYNDQRIITPVQYTNHKVIYNSQSLSGRQLRSNPNLAELWGLKFETVFSGQGIGEFFVDILQERETPSSMNMPQFPEIDTYEPDNTGALVVNSSVTPGSSTVNITNPTSAASGQTLLLKGTFIQFDNHNKLYVVTSTVTLDSTDITNGYFTLGVLPSVTKALTTSETMRTPYTSIRPTYHYYKNLSSLNGLTFEDSRIVSPGSIALIENLG